MVEGLTDYWYLDAIAHLLRDSGDADLNKGIAIVPANTAGKVVYFATILHANKLNQAAEQDILVHALGNKKILRTKDSYSGGVNVPEIEDLLRDTLVKVALEDLGWDVGATAERQAPRPIVDIFGSEISDFSKYKLSKAFLHWARTHEASDLTTDERRQWSDLISRINKALK